MVLPKTIYIKSSLVLPRALLIICIQDLDPPPPHPIGSVPHGRAEVKRRGPGGARGQMIPYTGAGAWIANAGHLPAS